MQSISKSFSEDLISWYLTNKRNLPWRETKNPYNIWLSEIILQQTRVQQGTPYYLKFIEAFPTIHDLARAKEDKVLKLWQGLGYYSRARNLHATAKEISQNHKGVFPDSYKELLKFKGIGSYTASAISSICFNRPEVVVDGNVYRVLSRIFGIETPINTHPAQKEFREIGSLLMDEKRPGKFNQALMEFGALQCVPANPDCQNCVFKDICFAYKTSSIDKLPVKRKPKPVRNRYFNFLVFLSDDDETILQQRKKKDIWKKLYQFPLIETPELSDLNQLKAYQEFQDYFKMIKQYKISLHNEIPIIHKLTHQNIHARFWIIYSDKIYGHKVSLSRIDDFPVPKLIEEFMESFFYQNKEEV